MKRNVLVGILLVCLVVGTIPISSGVEKSNSLIKEPDELPNQASIVNGHITNGGEFNELIFSPTPSEFVIKVVDVSGKPANGASVLILKYFETYHSKYLTIIDSGEANSEGFYYPSVDIEEEECDLITVTKDKWFTTIDLHGMSELPEVMEVPLLYEVLDTAETEVCEGKYKIFIWRDFDRSDPLDNTFYVELHAVGNPLPGKGVFGFTKDESVDVNHPGVIWFSNKDLNCLLVKKEQGIPAFGIYPTYTAFYIPDSTTIKKKEHLEKAGDTIVGLIPYVGNVYSFFDFVFGVFGEGKVIYSEQHPPEIDIDENKYDTTFETWKSDVLSEHVVVYVESMKFPEPGEYRIVPIIQFSPARIDCSDTCVWTKEINVHILGKSGSKAPDLTITSLSLNPENPKEGDEVTFSYTIKNQGTGKAGTSTTALFINGNNVCEDDVGRLDSGSYSEETFEDKWTATAGVFGVHVHKIRVVADYYEYVEESEEGNNEMIKPLGDISKLIDELVSRWNELIKFLNSLTS